MKNKIKLVIIFAVISIFLSSCLSNVQENDVSINETQQVTNNSISNVQEPTTPKVVKSISYVGAVDKYPIHMTIDFYDDNNIKGKYYYNKYKIDIPFSGFANGTAIEINTDDGNEQFFGNINENDIYGQWKTKYTTLQFSLIDESVYEENNEQFFKILGNLEFGFSSGAGAWGTSLNLNNDGSFSGNYVDNDMGDGGEGYPNGTRYVCNFSGKFSLDKKIDDNTYKLKLDYINLENEVDTEEIYDGVKVVYSKPYGIVENVDYTLCLPDKKRSELSEEVLSWDSKYYVDTPEPKILEGYVLYPDSEETAFYSYKN